MSQRHVHKFGGSSLADPSCFLRVADIIKRHTHDGDLMVVSASGKTTNRLLELISLAKANNSPSEALNSLIAYQRNLVEGLLDSISGACIIDALENEQREIALLLETELGAYQCNDVLSFGERWSARLLCALLNAQNAPCQWLDSRLFFRAQLGAQPQVDAQQSAPLLAQILAENTQQRWVVTGFIASDEQGRTVTLGRNGSDYSATELALLCDADSTTIWSDVAGIYSADPRVVSDATLQDKLALSEAAELSRIGSPVLHARTLEPLSRSRQELSLRSSYQPENGQTQIHRQRLLTKGAKIVTAVDDIVLCEFTLDEASISLNELIEQLDKRQLLPISQHYHEEQALVRLAYTRELVNDAYQWLASQQAAFNLAQLRIDPGYALVALIGAGVTENTEQCYRFYHHLARQPLEFLHASKNKLSLSAVLKRVTLAPLLIELHKIMFKQPTRLGMVVFGRGNIGSHWLALQEQQRHFLEQQYNVKVTLAGVFDRVGGHLDFNGIEFALALSDNLSMTPLDWPHLHNQLKAHPFDELVVVDITASEAVCEQYAAFAKQGFHVISASKLAGAASFEVYRQLKQSFVDHNAYWLSNATVGAGLPVQSSIESLRQAGDQVLAISGIFSGTLSWLFQQFDGTVPFSHLLDQAWQQGLTEPDPRDDLSGKDVQRKALILAREAGIDLDIAQISLQSLVPSDLLDMDLDDFIDNMHLLDDAMNQALLDAQEQGMVLRYLARVERDGGASVGLQAIEPNDPLANLNPCDNVFAIESRWYKPYPMIIKGPGSGRALTAGALQADLVKLCQGIG